MMPKSGIPLIYNNYITLVFPLIPDERPKLGRWRNVSKGIQDADVHDPGYVSATPIDAFDILKKSESKVTTLQSALDEDMLDMSSTRYFVWKLLIFWIVS